MQSTKLKRFVALYLFFVLAAVWMLAGCAPLLVAGGAVGGYAVAKDMEDGQLIDDQKKK